MARWRSSLWTIPIGVTCCQPPWLARSRLRWMIWRPIAIRALWSRAGTTFCAGAELATLEQAAEGDFSLIRGVYGGFLRILNSPLVTIGAINGAAVGAGFNLALACDVRVAAETARFVCRFAELRIFPGGGHGWLLSRAVGHQQATLALLLGQTWNADQAYR